MLLIEATISRIIISIILKPIRPAKTIQINSLTPSSGQFYLDGFGIDSIANSFSLTCGPSISFFISVILSRVSRMKVVLDSSSAKSNPNLCGLFFTTLKSIILFQFSTRGPRTERSEPSLTLTTDETYETDSSRSSKSHSADLTLLLSSDVSSLARDPFGVWASIRWRHSSNFVEQFETAELTSSRTTKYGSSIDISHLSKSSKDHHLIRPPIRIQN